MSCDSQNWHLYLVCTLHWQIRYSSWTLVGRADVLFSFCAFGSASPMRMHCLGKERGDGYSCGVLWQLDHCLAESRSRVWTRSENNVHIVIDTVSSTGTGTHWHAKMIYCNRPMSGGRTYPTCFQSTHASPPKHRIQEKQNRGRRNSAETETLLSIRMHLLQL